MVRRDDIDRVGVTGGRRRAVADAHDRHVGSVTRHQCPHRRAREMNALHHDVVGHPELHQPRPGQAVTARREGVARVGKIIKGWVAREIVPAVPARRIHVALAVDRAPADDPDVGGVVGGDQGFARPVAGPDIRGEIARLVGRAENRRAGGDAQQDVVLQGERTGEEHALIERHSPAAQRCTSVDRLLDGDGVVGDAVRDGAVGQRIARIGNGRVAHTASGQSKQEHHAKRSSLVCLTPNKVLRRKPLQCLRSPFGAHEQLLLRCRPR